MMRVRESISAATLTRAKKSVATLNAMWAPQGDLSSVKNLND